MSSRQTRGSRRGRGRTGSQVGTKPHAPILPAASAADGDGAPQAGVDPDPEPAAIVVSYCFEAGPADGPRYDATIRITGQRRGVDPRRSGIGDSFVRSEMVTGVAPGSGRVSVTSWVYGIAPGDWDVSAELVGPERARQANAGGRLPRARWSWRRWAVEPGPETPVPTRWALVAPLAASPGVVPGSFTVLAAVALATAVGLQPAFLAHHGIDVGRALLASLAGVALGLIGAKAWYVALKGLSRQNLREGWSVDGFLVTAPLAASAIALLIGEPLGAFLDAVAPGLFVAVAIGRIGCFLTGCCAGRTTCGLGIWSSDRRVGARRIPTQLMESVVGAGLATAAGVVVAAHVAFGMGLVFVTTVLLYAMARQGLLRLRAESRPFSWKRAASAARP